MESPKVEIVIRQRASDMKKILFLHPGKANLPEISIYKKFFFRYHFVNCQDLSSYSLSDFDLIWQFMGVDLHFRKSIPTIHEYASLSVGRGNRIKDLMKRWLNARPSMRIFLNSSIRDAYGFADGVPYCYRDMGVDRRFFEASDSEIMYDFVYVGAMNSSRNFHNVLDFFVRNPKHSILLIGKPSDDLYDAYKRYPNIIFAGTVSYQDVPRLAKQARYALNYIPNKYPYSLQTSTKLLEYVAMGMKVITTSYHWVNHFEAQRKMRFYKIREDFSGFDWDELNAFSFCNTGIEDLKWEHILRNSGLDDALMRLLGE